MLQMWRTHLHNTKIQSTHYYSTHFYCYYSRLGFSYAFSLSSLHWGAPHFCIASALKNVYRGFVGESVLSLTSSKLFWHLNSRVNGLHFEIFNKSHDARHFLLSYIPRNLLLHPSTSKLIYWSQSNIPKLMQKHNSAFVFAISYTSWEENMPKSYIRPNLRLGVRSYHGQFV